MGQGKEMEKKSEPVSMPNMSRETFMAEEISALQSKSNDSLTTSRRRTSQRIKVNEAKGSTTVTTETPPAKISVLQNPKSSDLREELNC